MDGYGDEKGKLSSGHLVEVQVNWCTSTNSEALKHCVFFLFFRVSNLRCLFFFNG